MRLQKINGKLMALELAADAREESSMRLSTRVLSGQERDYSGRWVKITISQVMTSHAPT